MRPLASGVRPYRALRSLCAGVSLITVMWGGASYAADHVCRHTLLAHVPLYDKSGFLISPVEIDGHTVSMIMDTGSEGSLISPDGADAMGLPLDKGMHTVVQGTGGGQRLVPNVHVRSLKVGGVETGPLSVPVGYLPGKPVTQPPVEGLVGGDLLSRYDVEFNVAEGWLNLWQPAAPSSGCDGPEGWHVIYRALPVQFDGRRVSVQLVLDGMPVKALVDSGARSRIVSEAAALRTGLSAQTLATDPGGVTSGIDGRQQRYYWHKFNSLQYGLEEEKQPVLTVSPLKDNADMLLGADWFAAHRVWLSYRSGKLYIMPSLRPVKTDQTHR
ncbi:retroviral-like aspartic protease family protein [Acetobacter sp. DsW_059]|uniref:retroviral-like aspartic protease family protein n=1 Tax=Acetobacter sp. DsW_059 TaxID=1670661 RepID=UPI000A3A751F|nr:retroviral-like aspartic protease family protein [Acetobacter sp. DsW_059]